MFVRLSKKVLYASIPMIGIMVFYLLFFKDIENDSDSLSNMHKQQEEATESVIKEFHATVERPDNSNQVKSDALRELATKDLEEVKALRKEDEDQTAFSAETLALAQDVKNAARRISYFQAREAMIENLKSKENIELIEEIILNYDKGKYDLEELPTLIHFGFIAIGELAPEEGLERATSIYQHLTKRLAKLENTDSRRIHRARVNDIYDLVRNVLKSADRELGLSEVFVTLEQLGVRNNFLSHDIKQQLKNAVSFAVDLKTVENLENLNQELDDWWN